MVRKIGKESRPRVSRLGIVVKSNEQLKIMARTNLRPALSYMRHDSRSRSFRSTRHCDLYRASIRDTVRLFWLRAQLLFSYSHPPILYLLFHFISRGQKFQNSHLSQIFIGLIDFSTSGHKYNENNLNMICKYV